MTWEKGRQLKSFDSNTYTYNANGVRASKTINGVMHAYTLDGMKILHETWGSNTLIPLYDNEDSVCGIIYNNVPYYFLKNLQGDVIAITDTSGSDVAKYTYDAWGVCMIASDTSSVGIAAINPFRYRGYYYDGETALYYLQSHYYDPETGRFINADEPVMLALNVAINGAIGANLFAYCTNNPVMHSDPNGYVKSSKYWWGVRYIWSYAEANKKVNQFNDLAATWALVAAGSATVAFIASKITAIFSFTGMPAAIAGAINTIATSIAVVFGLASAYFWKLSSSIQMNNIGKGVTLNINWWLTFSCYSN